MMFTENKQTLRCPWLSSNTPLHGHWFHLMPTEIGRFACSFRLLSRFRSCTNQLSWFCSGHRPFYCSIEQTSQPPRIWKHNQQKWACWHWWLLELPGRCASFPRVRNRHILLGGPLLQRLVIRYWNIKRRHKVDIMGIRKKKADFSLPAACKMHNYTCSGCDHGDVTIKEQKTNLDHVLHENFTFEHCT